MLFSQRDFIKDFGLTLARLVASEAASTREPGQADDEPADARHPAWGRLRQCWLDLNQPVVLDAHDRLDECQKAHQVALDELVAANEVDAPVADQMQTAFKEGVNYTQQPMVMCYIAVTGVPQVFEDPPQQAKLLDEVAGDLDPEVAAKAQAALVRDMAFFDALAAGELASELYKRHAAGEIVASPEALEAARILMNLLLVRQT